MTSLTKREENQDLPGSEMKIDKKIMDIDIPTIVDVQSEFISEGINDLNCSNENEEGFCMMDGENSKISKQTKNTPIESDISGGLGSYPQKFAYYDNNTFFAEHLLEDKEIERKNIHFVNDEMKKEENIFIFKKVLNIIEKHMNNSWCPLNFLREGYINYLKNNFKIHSFSFFEINGKVLNNKNNNEQKILQDIDCFITIFKACIFDFYHISTNLYITSNTGLRTLFSTEAFRYFLINSLFNKDEFYTLAFEVEKKKNFKEEEEFQDGIQKYPYLLLEDFGNSKEFLLNENPLIENEKKNVDYSSLNYMLAIDCIKNLQYIKSPVHKLKSIILCGLMIKKSIEDFYFKLHKKVTNDMMRPREFIRIFFFTVYKSKIPCMLTHFKMIKEFLHNDILEHLRLPFYKYFKLSIDFFKIAKGVTGDKIKFTKFLNEFLEEHDFA